MRYRGKIAEWNDARGFGFIVPLKGGARVFVHVSSFQNGRRPSGNEFVTYTLGRDGGGRSRAEEVLYLAGSQDSGRPRTTPRGIDELLAWCLAGGFLTFVVAAAAVEQLWWPVAGAYVGMSFFTYSTYKQDKLAAKTASWRTTELTLISLGLIGGWPGALVAQRRLRHKTRKIEFQLGFWVSVATNVAVLAWLMSG